MKFRPVKSVGIIVAVAIFSVASVIIAPLSAHADIFSDWAFYPSSGARSEGYFSNNGISDTLNANRKTCGLSACPVIPNDNYTRDSLNAGYFRQGNMNTSTSIQRAHDLVNDLKTISTWGGWESAGVAFIVNTMLGYSSDSPSKTRTITAAMWNEVENRLVDRAEKGRINWNVDFSSNGQDTYTRIINGSWDVVYDQTWQTRNGIIIYDDAGNEAYRIWYSCANPVGTVRGLPPVTPYNLVPTIAGSPTTIDSGTPISLVPTIRNTGLGASKTAQWEMTTFVVPAKIPANPVPGGATNATSPQSYYGYGAGPLAVGVSAGSGTYTSSSPSLVVPDQPTGDYPVGTRICFTLSVRPYNQATTDWRHGVPFCVTVAKKPKVQVLGGDLVVGRASPYNPTQSSRVATSTSFSSATNLYYGSWSEYAIVPTGIVTGMASASTYVGGRTSADSTLCNLSLLTFTNRSSASCQPAAVGNYLSGSTAPDLQKRFVVSAPGPISTASVDLNSLGNALVYTTTQANLSISSSAAFGSGRWVVINAPNTTVTITSNINYASAASLGNMKAIPQVVIIARNILIADSVTNVDSWLIATGAGANAGIINTCSSVPSGAPTSAVLNANRCGNGLTVNGPVLANKLYMYRTAGAGTGPATGVPAEKFNLRADAYLWATVYGSGSGRVSTVSTKELPPRF